MLAGFLDSCKHGGPPFKDTPLILIIAAHVKDNRLNLWHRICDPFSDFQRTTPMFIGTYKIPTLLCCRRKVRHNAKGEAAGIHLSQAGLFTLASTRLLCFSCFDLFSTLHIRELARGFIGVSTTERSRWKAGCIQVDHSCPRDVSVK